MIILLGRCDAVWWNRLRLLLSSVMPNTFNLPSASAILVGVHTVLLEQILARDPGALVFLLRNAKQAENQASRHMGHIGDE